jgi:hypothetical protein
MYNFLFLMPSQTHVTNCLKVALLAPRLMSYVSRLQEWILVSFCVSFCAHESLTYTPDLE